MTARLNEIPSFRHKPVGGAEKYFKPLVAPDIGWIFVRYQSLLLKESMYKIWRIGVICPTAVVLLTVVVLSLVWCGEASCLRGHENDDCTTLFCALANKSTTATASRPAHANSCCCSLSHITGLPTQSDEVLIEATAPLMPSGPSDSVAEPPQRVLFRPPAV